MNSLKSFQKQGILSILESPTNPSPSLRRTLSADMSSTNFFTLHGFSVEGQGRCDDFKEERDGFWGSVPQDEKKIKIRDLDSWSSILLQSSAPDAVVPYVHPLLKKSTNCLSENSLLICTESLGSESASDGFPSGDFDGEMLKTETFEWKPIKFRRKKTPPRSFPPPISSLTSPDHGGSLCIQSRRENGRLILDAVSVPSRKNFRAVRRDGRLILSCVTTPANLNVQEEELIAGEFEEFEKAPRLSSSVMNFNRLAMMMKKPNRLINWNPAWPKEKEAPLSQSLPPRPPSLTTATAAASLNSYEYYWRSKPAGIQNPIAQQHNQPPIKNNEMANEKHQILVLRGNRGDYLVRLSNGCKLPRRSLLLREPCCIATT